VSANAKDVPIITGTAAPERVFGLAANTHAFKELTLTSVFSMIMSLFFEYPLAKLNIKPYICKK
jgi:hypothetical protein